MAKQTTKSHVCTIKTRSFSDLFRDGRPGPIDKLMEGVKVIKGKIDEQNRRQASASQKFGRKPTFEEAYSRIIAGDDDFTEALKLAYPDLHKEVMQEVSKDARYDVPPPYARLYSDNSAKKTFWRKHRKKILAAAAMTAAAGLGYGAKTLLDKYGNDSKAGENGSATGSTATSAPDARPEGKPIAPAANKEGNAKKGGGQETLYGRDFLSRIPVDTKQPKISPKNSVANFDDDAVVQKPVEYFTKEEKDAIFEPMGKKMDGATDFVPLADDILSMCDKYCKALETKYIRPEDVKTETDMLKACSGLMQALLSQLAQKGDTSDKITQVSTMISRLSRINLKVGTAAA